MATLTPSERKIADLLLGRPQSVAFGTVAAVAAATGTSGATVVRLAVKLGFSGYADLQAEVRDELTSSLGPAAQRIHRPPARDTVGQVLDRDTDNVRSTLEGLDPAEFEQTVRWLTDGRRTVALCPGDCARGVGLTMYDQLGALRPGVLLLDGNAVRVGREVAALGRGDVLVAIDLHRYDRQVLVAARHARERGAKTVALTDSRTGGLAQLADVVHAVSALGVGPFDSQVGTLALAHALVARSAAVLRPQASRRLQRAEELWGRLGALAGDS